MGKTFLPLAKSPIATPDLWVKTARNWLATGVIKAYLNELQVYADSTGMQVKVKSGAANVQGIYFDSDAEEVLSIATANASNPRIDRIILRLDLSADSIDLAVLQGTPAASPVGPSLTQNGTRWEISLGYIYVNAGTATIAAGNVYDERAFVEPSRRTEQLEVSFVSAGTSNYLSANVTFSRPFTSVPVVKPGNITNTIGYSDVMCYPFITSVTKTGFSVSFRSTGGNFASGTLKMMFEATGY